MLTIHVPLTPDVESFNNETQKFVTEPGATYPLKLEHSLVSLSKWESVFEKPFFSGEERTTSETLGYVRAMIITPDVPEEVLDKITSGNIVEINKYINSKSTATWFSEERVRPSREVITSELIYYWLVAHTIPFECENWHLNRLFTLIRICNQKNGPEQKMSAREVADRNRSLNEQRKAKYQTQG